MKMHINSKTYTTFFQVLNLLLFIGLIIILNIWMQKYKFEHIINRFKNH
jgi:hypothetical protein